MCCSFSRRKNAQVSVEYLPMHHFLYRPEQNFYFLFVAAVELEILQLLIMLLVYLHVLIISE